MLSNPMTTVHTEKGTDSPIGKNLTVIALWFVLSRCVAFSRQPVILRMWKKRCTERVEKRVRPSVWMDVCGAPPVPRLRGTFGG